MVKPNEKAKLFCERVCWNAYRKQSDPKLTGLITLLPYFMVGPPLYKSTIESNSSC